MGCLLVSGTATGICQFQFGGQRLLFQRGGSPHLNKHGRKPRHSSNEQPVVSVLQSSEELASKRAPCIQKRDISVFGKELGECPFHFLLQDLSLEGGGVCGSLTPTVGWSYWPAQSPIMFLFLLLPLPPPLQFQSHLNCKLLAGRDPPAHFCFGAPSPVDCWLCRHHNHRREDSWMLAGT